MREIKFRAWYYDGKNLDSGEMLEGIPIGWSESLISNIAYIEGKWTNCIKAMQFTGLKDKNGKEIWEGDIVKLIIRHQSIENGNSIETEISQVEFTPAYFRLRGSILGAGSLIEENLEIISNIYENPELLK